MVVEEDRRNGWLARHAAAGLAARGARAGAPARERAGFTGSGTDRIAGNCARSRYAAGNAAGAGHGWSSSRVAAGAGLTEAPLRTDHHVRIARRQREERAAEQHAPSRKFSDQAAKGLLAP